MSTVSLDADGYGIACVGIQIGEGQFPVLCRFPCIALIDGEFNVAVIPTISDSDGMRCGRQFQFLCGFVGLGRDIQGYDIGRFCVLGRRHIEIHRFIVPSVWNLHVG